MKTYTLNNDGSLTIRKDNGLDENETPMFSQTDIAADQIHAFRRDPEFAADLPADIRAALDAQAQAIAGAV